MGSCSCQMSAVIEINRKEEENSIISKKLIPSSPKKIDIETIIEAQKKEYPDMLEWEGEKYKGIGIKRMKGYKCDLPIDKLNKKREEFWNNRGSHGNPNYKIWRVINQACVYDEYRANVLLEEYELTTFDGCINHIVDKKNIHYIVNNLMSGEDLKKLFCEKNNISLDKYNIRMFFAGNEIHDNHYLYQYKIHNGYKIQVMKSVKIKEE